MEQAQDANRKEEAVAGSVKKEKRWKLEESGLSAMQDKDEADRGKFATCWRGQARLRAIFRGMEWAAEQVVMKAGSVEARQRVVEQLYLHASRVTCEPVRSRALAHATAMEHWWKQSRVGVMEWNAPESSDHTAAEVVRMVRRVYAVESVGLYDDAKRELLRLLGSRTCLSESDGDSCSGLPYTVVDYLGFDPLHGEVTEVWRNCHVLRDKHRRLATALEIAWMADRTELPLGRASLFLAVLECLRSLRPYMGPYQVGYEEYKGQVHLITTVVLLLSKMGELQMLSHLLPHETLFLRYHLPVLLLRRDTVLVARTVEALKVLGSTEDDQLIQVGLAFLLAHQDEHGYWKGASDSKSTVDECYEATTAAIRALLVHEFRGFGPVPPETVSVLLQWQKLDEDCSDTDTAPPPPNALLLPTGEIDTRLAGVKEAAESFLASCKSVRPPAPTPLVQRPLIGARVNLPLAQRSDSEISYASGPVVQRSDSDFSLSGERGENGVMSKAPVVQPPGMSLRDWILELKGKLKTADEQKDWKGVYRTLKALSKIKGFDDPKLLSDTEIGKVVNSFAKKCENERCRTLAQEVVGKWKIRAKERQAAEQAKGGVQPAVP